MVVLVLCSRADHELTDDGCADCHAITRANYRQALHEPADARAHDRQADHRPHDCDADGGTDRRTNTCAH